MKHFLWLLLLWGCSGLEKSEKERLFRANSVEEPIYRNEDEHFATESEPLPQKRAQYSWEKNRGTLYPRITKEYFRCRGSKQNPPIKASPNREAYYLDCGGFAFHSLPVRDEEEFIFPRLIEILNYIQEEGKKRVHITCGHRCPDHNRYSEPKKSSSYHMIGAEVDFYVDDMQPNKVVELIQNIVSAPLKQSGNVWSNDEMTLRIYGPDEGRDIDNNHNLPYIALRLKKSEGKNIVYSWNAAARGYLRW